MSLKISEINVDKDFMMRESLDKQAVAEYKENLEQILAEHPIVVFETPNGKMLVDGFHRLAAARQLNWESIPAELKKGSVQEAFAYACLANLKHGKPLKPTERKKAIREFLKLNVKFSNVQIAKAVSVSEPTIRRLREELEEVGEIEPQEKRTGADGKERVFVNSNIPTSSNDEVDPFNVWFNSHVNESDVFEALKEDTLQYDLIIVDPPYGITKQLWDKEDKFELLNFTRRWLNVVLQHLKPTGRLFIFWSREYLFDLKPLLDEIKNEYPINFGGLIVWNFRNTIAMPSNLKEFKLTWEPIFYFYGMQAIDLNRPDTEITGEKWDDASSDVWTFAIPQSNFEDKRIHPTQKPVELYKRMIKLSTKANDLILDPFAGSGTTGHAAYELGREFRLIEKNPEYIDGIKNRLRGVFKE